MKMIKMALTVFVLAAAVTIVNEIPAHAAFRSYSPSGCNSALNGAIWGNPSFFLFPTAASAPSGAVVFVCPVVRENVSSTTGLGFAEVVVNNPSGQETTCEIFSVDLFGNTIDFESTSGGTSGGIQILSFGGPGTSDVDSTYGFACSVPSGGAILSYLVDEN